MVRVHRHEREHQLIQLVGNQRRSEVCLSKHLHCRLGLGVNVPKQWRPAERAHLVHAPELQHARRACVLRVSNAHGQKRVAHVEADAALARLLHDAVEDIVHNLGSSRERLTARSRLRSSAAIRHAPLQSLDGLTRGLFSSEARSPRLDGLTVRLRLTRGHHTSEASAVTTGPLNQQ